MEARTVICNSISMQCDRNGVVRPPSEVSHSTSINRPNIYSKQETAHTVLVEGRTYHPRFCIEEERRSVCVPIAHYHKVRQVEWELEGRNIHVSRQGSNSPHRTGSNKTRGRSVSTACAVGEFAHQSACRGRGGPSKASACREHVVRSPLCANALSVGVSIARRYYISCD